MEPSLLGVLGAAEDRFDPYAERILDSARDQFLSYGLRRTSLEDIAKAAGVSRATLFRRFPNRDVLTTALALREARAVIASVDERVAGISDAETLVITGFLAVVDQITTNPLLRRLLITDPDLVLPVATERGQGVLALGRAYIAGILRRISSQGPPLAGDAEVLAEMLARLVISFALNPVSVLPLDDRSRLEELVRTTLLPNITTGTRETR